MQHALGKAAEVYSQSMFSLSRYGDEMEDLFEASYSRSRAAMRKLKTVLFIHSSDDGYGSDKVLLQVLQELDRDEFYPIVLLPDDTAHIGLLSPHLRRLHIEYLHAPLPILRRHYFDWHRFYRFGWKLLSGNVFVLNTIIRKRVDIVYCNTVAVVPCAPGIALSQRPVLWHVHELLELGSVLRPFVHIVVGATSKRILSISRAVQDHILRDIPWASRKATLVPNAIDTSRAPSISRAEARKLIGVGQEDIVVGMVGRISEWKGQRLLVRAMALLRDRGVMATAVIVGDVFDSQEKHLEDLRKEISAAHLEDQVRLAGYTEKPLDILAAFDVFVLPSLRPEPFGLVVLEAMNCGIPTIASAHGGPVEIIRDGVTGFLVSPNNEMALANSIESLILNPDLRESMGSAARSEIRRSYDLRNFGKRIRQVFREIAP